MSGPSATPGQRGLPQQSPSGHPVTTPPDDLAVSPNAVPASAWLPPGQRGATVIADQVIERIVARVVAEAEHASGAARRVAGMSLGDDENAAAQANVYVDGNLATVQLTMSVLYPEPVRQVARRVREQVAARIGELTGLDVRQVDIQISSLIAASSAGRRVQ